MRALIESLYEFGGTCEQPDVTLVERLAMDVIVLDGDSDEGEHTIKKDVSAGREAEGYGRPAKRQRREPSSQWDTTNEIDLCEGLSHVSDTVQEPSVTEAPVQPTSAAADGADSPTLSPQQVCYQVLQFLGTIHGHVP